MRADNAELHTLHHLGAGTFAVAKQVVKARPVQPAGELPLSARCGAQAGCGSMRRAGRAPGASAGARPMRAA